MESLRDFCVVRVPSVFIDESKYKGINGQALLMIVLDNPQVHVRCHGEIMSVPSELLHTPLYSKPNGVPGYSYNQRFDFTRQVDIAQEVKVGDKAYFHYACLLPDMHLSNYNHNFLYSETLTVNGKPKVFHYFRIKYDLIFSTVRYEKMGSPELFDWSKEGDLKELGAIPSDPSSSEPVEYADIWSDGKDNYRKVITMIGSYAYVKPDKETWKDISIPLPEVVNGKVLLDKRGQPIMKPEEEWLVTKATPEDKYLSGWIAYVGTPLKGHPASVKPGMYVYIRYYMNTRVEFEGEEYYRVRQNFIGMVDPAKSNGQVPATQGATALHGA